MLHPVHHLKQNHKQQVLNVDTLCWQRLVKTEIKLRFESNTNHNRDNMVISNTHDAASRTSKRRNSDTLIFCSSHHHYWRAIKSNCAASPVMA